MTLVHQRNTHQKNMRANSKESPDWAKRTTNVSATFTFSLISKAFGRILKTRNRLNKVFFLREGRGVVLLHHLYWETFASDVDEVVFWWVVYFRARGSCRQSLHCTKSNHIQGAGWFAPNHAQSA